MKLDALSFQDVEAILASLAGTLSSKGCIVASADVSLTILKYTGQCVASSQALLLKRLFSPKKYRSLYLDHVRTFQERVTSMLKSDCQITLDDVHISIQHSWRSNRLLSASLIVHS